MVLSLLGSVRIRCNYCLFLCVSIICGVSADHHFSFGSRVSYLPVRSRLIIGVIDRGAYLFACIIGVRECFISCEFGYLVGSHFWWFVLCDFMEWYFSA